MTTRTLFNIVLKIIGLLFIQHIIYAAVTIIGTIFFWGQQRQASYALEVISALLPFALYSLAAYLLIFRSDSIVNSMKLHEGLGIDIIPINMHRSTVLSIALIIIGGLLLIEELPNLCRQLFSYYKKSEMAYGSADASYIVFSVFKIIIGLLIIGNQRKLVSLIEINSKPRP